MDAPEDDWTPPVVREAKLEDARLFTEFLADLFAEGLPTIWSDTPTNSVQGRLFLHGLVSNPRSVVLLAFDAEERVCGCLHFAEHRHAQRRHSGLLGISVRADCRGRGVGSRLLEALDPWARAHDFRRLELEVFGNNPRAVALYERHGYEHEGRRHAAVLVEGDYVDLHLMAKTLGE